MFGILGWLTFGFVLGVIARLVMRGRDPDGALLTMLIAVDGALLGGFLSVATKLAAWGEPASLVAAAVGAVVALGLKLLSVRHDSRVRVEQQSAGRAVTP